MRSYLSTAMVVVGTVVGAGFASGREVYHFFVRFGSNGLLGAALSAVLMATIGFWMTILCQRHGSREFTELVAARRSRRVASVLSLCLSISMWLGLGVMLSGAGEASHSLGVPRVAGVIVTGLLVTGAITYGIRGLKTLNVGLTPVIMFVILWLFVLAWTKTSGAYLILQPVESSWTQLVGSAMLYAALNSMTLVVVIPPLLSGDGTTKGVAIGFLLVALLLAMVTVLILSFSSLVRNSPVPLLDIVGVLTPRVPQIYALLLWAALSTTALAHAYGVSQQLRHMTGLSQLYSGAIVLLSTLPLALMLFGQLVSTVYPCLGYVGLCVVAAVLFPRSSPKHSG